MFIANKLSSHYAWNLINPNPLPPLPRKRKRNSHPPYKQMICRALEDSNGKTSVIAIRKYIHANYTIGSNATHCIRLSLCRMVEAGEIIRVAASYRLVKSTPTATKKWLE